MSLAVGMAPRLGRLRSELGAWNAALYLTSRALERVSGGRARIVKYYIVAQPVQPVPLLRPDPRTRVRFIDGSSALAATFPRPRHVIERRYAGGSRCLTATVDDEFAGFLWWQRDRYDEDEVRCTYVLSQAGRSVWDYDVHVEPRFRMGRTLARLWQAANEHLAGEGVRWSFSRISAFNQRSLTCHARLGMRACYAATFCIVGPLQFAVFGAAPFVHLSLSASQRPVFRLAVPAAGEP